MVTIAWSPGTDSNHGDSRCSSGANPPWAQIPALQTDRWNKDLHRKMKTLSPRPENDAETVELRLHAHRESQLAARLSLGNDSDTFKRKFISSSPNTLDVFHAALKSSSDIHIADIAATGDKHGIPPLVSKVDAAGVAACAADQRRRQVSRHACPWLITLPSGVLTRAHGR